MDWDCPVCGNSTQRTFTARSGYPIRSCGACTHRFVEYQPPSDHVARTYDDNYFFGGGTGYVDYPRNSAMLQEHGRQYARILRPYVTMGAALDVGAAAGFICDGFRSEGWSVEALEPNPGMARYAREQLKLTVHTTDLEHATIARRYDLVSMIQVVAHFACPRCAFSKAADLTRSGGFWLVETWDHRSLTARVLGKSWHEYDPPRVLQFFTRQSLERLAADFSLRRIASGRPRKRIEWRRARLLLIESAPWLRYVIPPLPGDLILPYPAEDLFWMLFQKD